MTYAEKLKDPRWQKKRLEILERDEWMCQSCQDKESTLHVHHLRYSKNKNPWDIDEKYLLTLCAECHKEETVNGEISNKKMVSAMSYNGFMSFEVGIIADAIYKNKIHHQPEIKAHIINYALGNDDICELMTEIYFLHIRSKAKIANVLKGAKED